MPHVGCEDLFLLDEARAVDVPLLPHPVVGVGERRVEQHVVSGELRFERIDRLFTGEAAVTGEVDHPEPAFRVIVNVRDLYDGMYGLAGEGARARAGFEPLARTLQRVEMGRNLQERTGGEDRGKGEGDVTSETWEKRRARATGGEDVRNCLERKG